MMFKDLDIQILTGDKLEADIAMSETLFRRDCFTRLKEYLERPAGKVMFLNGLRRTGKTVMAKQGLAELPKKVRKNAVYIKFPYCNEGIPKKESYDLIEDLRDEGYRYFFLDESTVISEFPSFAKDIADGPVALGCHVVLLGTDSLSMWLSVRNALEGRYTKIRTSRIPFHEWCRLLQKNGRKLTIDDYIHYGGILDFDDVTVENALVNEIKNSFRDPSSVEQYVYMAIAMNVQNSVARNAGAPEFSALYPLWEDGKLVKAVQGIVQDQNYRIVRRKFCERFKNINFFEENKKIKKFDFFEVCKKIKNFDFFSVYKKIKDFDPGSQRFIKEKKEEILYEIERRLSISHGGIQLSKDDCIAVENYLRKIDVFTDVEVRILPSLNSGDRRNQKLYRSENRVLQTQPGIRTGQMQLACSIVWNILEINRSPITKDEFLQDATSIVNDQMLKDIVFADLADALPDGCHIFKLEWEAGVDEKPEFDVAIVDERDPHNPRVSLFEVKYTENIHASETKHLKNSLLIDQVSKDFGKVLSRAVVYKGATERGAVLYVNADEYLAVIGQDIEKALFPQLVDCWSSEDELEDLIDQYPERVKEYHDSDSDVDVDDDVDF